MIGDHFVDIGLGIEQRALEVRPTKTILAKEILYAFTMGFKWSLWVILPLENQAIVKDQEKPQGMDESLKKEETSSSQEANKNLNSDWHHESATNLNFCIVKTWSQSFMFSSTCLLMTVKKQKVIIEN